MKTFPEFQDYLATELGDSLSELEQRRSNMRYRKGWTGAILAALILGSWSIYYLGFMPQYGILIVAAVATPIAIFAFIRFFYDPDIPSDFKNMIVKKLVEFVDPSLEYLPEDHIEYHDFEASKLFLVKPDFFIGDDLINGYVGEVPLSFSELYVAFEREDRPKSKNQSAMAVFDDEDNLLLNMVYAVKRLRKKLVSDDKFKQRKSKKLLFHGMFLVTESPVEFSGDIYILPSKLYKKFGHVGTLIQAHNFLRGKHLLPKNIKFRENFVVYAQDLLEGEYVLTEDFMQKMLNLRKQAKADVHISIREGKIYMAVHLNREIFKINTGQNLTHTGYLQSFYNDLYLMLNLVHELNPATIKQEMEAPEAFMTEDEDEEGTETSAEDFL